MQWNMFILKNAIINTIEEKRLSQLKEENEKYRNSH